MALSDHRFVAWEEHIICSERGKRLVHFYLKDSAGQSVVAVVGTERSIRHMTYVVSDEFVNFYLTKRSIPTCMKWRARREVVDWLATLLTNPEDTLNSMQNYLTQRISSRHFLPDHMAPRKLKAQNSDIDWSGIPWICTKHLKHYPAFYRNGASISVSNKIEDFRFVHTFVFIMAEDEVNYLGYLEDAYENKKGQKKVKVRWFHHPQEVKCLMPQLNTHSREVFITPHVQVISAECIVGPASVLTPKHYEKYFSVFRNGSLSGIFMCFRQFKNNKIKAFALTKLRSYSCQAIISTLENPLVSIDKRNVEELNEVSVQNGKATSFLGNQMIMATSACPKLKLRLLRKSMGIQVAKIHPHVSFKVNEKIELLCQDSGIRGCWFRGQVLQTTQKKIRMKYADLLDVDGSGNLEEWVPATRMAAPDKLGLRCSGRLTIRSCPAQDFAACKFLVGDLVDAWWNDGWWEAIVIGFDCSRNDILKLYFSGEEKLMSFSKKDVRLSRDWFENRWVDLKPRADIHAYLSKLVSSSLNSIIFPSKPEKSETTVINPRIVEAQEQEMSDLSPDNHLPLLNKNDDDKDEEHGAGEANDITKSEVVEKDYEPMEECAAE